MPGILGIIRPQPFQPEVVATLDRMAEPLRYAPDQTVQHFQRGRFAGSVVDYGPRFEFLKSAVAERDGVLLLMDGEVFPDASEVPHELQGDSPTVQRAEYCLHLYLERGPQFVKSLNGTFAIAVYDQRDNTLHLYTDRFPSRILPYWQSDGQLVFSSSLRSLLLYRDDIGRQYDRLAMAELCVFERVIGEKTLFTDIRRLPPACHAIWNGGSLTRMCYTSVSLQTRPAHWRSWQDASREFLERLRIAIKRRSGDGAKTGVLISGGIDSRLVLALAEPGVIAATYANRGQTPCKEELLAQRAARSCDVPMLRLERGQDYYTRITRPAAEIVEGFWTLSACHALGTHEQMIDAGIQVLISAHYFDTFFKGFFGEPVLPDVQYPNAPPDLHARRAAHALTCTLLVRKSHHQDLMTLAFRDEMKEVIAVAREHAVWYLSHWLSQDAPWLDLVDTAVPRDLQSSGASIASMRDLSSTFVNRSPIYDNHLYDLAWQIPYAWKSRGRLVRYALRLVSKELAWIPDSNTGLPGGLCPPWDRMALQTIEGARRIGRQLSLISRSVASLRSSPSGTQVYRSSWMHDVNALLKLSADYRALVEAAIDQLDREMFDTDRLHDLLRDELVAPAPRLRPLWDMVLTIGLFDRKWGPRGTNRSNAVAASQ